MKTPAIVCLVCLVSMGCGGPEIRQSGPITPVVRAVRARTETWTPLLTTFGNVVQRSEADVYPTSAGTIEALLAEEGDQVRSGQILARLDTTRLLIQKDELLAEAASRETSVALARVRLAEARKSVEARLLGLERSAASVEQARVEFEAADKTYLATQELFTAGGVPEAEMDRMRTSRLNAKTGLFKAQKDHESALIGFRAEDLRSAGMAVPTDSSRLREAFIVLNTRLERTEVDVAQSGLDAARAQLRSLGIFIEETDIRSPIDGIVAVRHLDLGERADVDRPLFTIMDISSVFVQAEVGERDLPSVRRGAGATVTFETIPPLVLEGTVRFITPFLSPQTRTARIRVELDNAAGRLSPGLFARLAIRTDSPREVIILPASVLVEEPQKPPIVYLVRNQRVFRTEVVVGERSGDRLIIESGIEDGDWIVRNPSALPDGTEVRLEIEH